MNDYSPSSEPLRQLAETYAKIEEIVRQRLDEFREMGVSEDETALFAELVFCLLTPQSNALRCWEAVTRLRRKKLMLAAAEDRIASELAGVRFHNNKARYIVSARRLFRRGGRWELRRRLDEYEDSFQRREWVVEHVKGLGYKEASHFLRNIGLGANFAILDRHILRSLLTLRVIEHCPMQISKTCYLEIEEKMKEFASRVAIPMDHLDLVLWYAETGIVFR